MCETNYSLLFFSSVFLIAFQLIPFMFLMPDKKSPSQIWFEPAFFHEKVKISILIEKCKGCLLFSGLQHNSPCLNLVSN